MKNLLLINKEKAGRKGIFFLLLLLFFNIVASSQSQISGPQNVDPGVEVYYEAAFENAPLSQSIIVWSVQNGEIVEENVNPNAGPIYCKVKWFGTSPDGVISVYEDLYSQTAERNVHINLCGDPSVTFTTEISCSGSVQINNYPDDPEYTVQWSPSNGLSNPFIAQPIASPSVTTTYTCQWTPKNLIANGDFELGYVNFHSDYLKHPQSLSSIGPGRYILGSLTTDLDPTLCQVGTFSGNGKMMIIDGYNSSSESFWLTTVNVTPNARYTFSFIVQTLSSELPQLEVRFNGIPQNIQAINWNGCGNTGWRTIAFEWTAPSGRTDVDIELINLNNAYSGNDFAIDDLALVRCTRQSTATIIVDGPVSISGQLQYFRKGDGSTAFPTSDYYVEPISTCKTNQVCFRMDEGDLKFSLTSSSPSNNEWQILRDGSPYLTASNFTGWWGSGSAPPNNLQTYEAHFMVYWSYPYTTESVFEIRLKNSITNTVVKSMFVKIKPQGWLSQGVNCFSSNGWMNAGVGGYHLSSSTQYSWKLQNQTSGFVADGNTVNNQTLKYQGVFTPFIAEAIANDPVSGCAASIYVNISPNGCSGYHNRVNPYVVSESAGGKDELSIFPNPARNVLEIVSSKKIAYVEIRSSEGKTVKIFRSFSIGKVNISDLSTGAYFMIAHFADNSRQYKTFIKQ